MEERFGQGAEIVNVIVRRDGGSLASGETLVLMARLSQAAAQLGNVTSVRSPLSAIDVTPDAVLSANAQQQDQWAATLAAAAAQSAGDLGALIAPDASLAAVAAIVPAVSDNDEGARIAAAHAAMRDAVAADFPAYEILQTGRVPMDAAFLEESRDDVASYTDLQLILLTVIVFLAFGSLSLTLALLVLMVSVVMGTVGLIGWTGFALNGISSAAPAVLMGLTVASAVHIALAWQGALRRGLDRRTAVALAYTRNAKPVLLSTLTTMVSFLLLNIAEAPPFRDLGNLVALGLVGILIVCFTVLPALLLVLPRSAGKHRQWAEHALARLVGRLARERIPVLSLTGAIALMSIAAISTIEIDDTFSHYFDERYEIRRATDLFEERLSGTTIIDIAVDLGSDGAAFDTRVFARAAEVSRWLTGQAEVARVSGPARIQAVFGADDAPPAAYQAAMEAMVREGLPRFFDDGGRHIRFQVVMRGVSSRDTLRFRDRAEAHVSEAFPSSAVSVTGIPILSAQLSLGSARAMVIGMAIALAAISLIMVLALGDVRLGLVSLLPNLLPVTMAFALWAGLAGEISFAATVVGALTYGIVVDDTVHILAKYQRFRRSAPVAEAIAKTYRSAGVAVVVTSLALGLSFLPFALSGFLVNHQFGALTALTLGAALIADIAFLPALLTSVDRKGGTPRMADGAQAGKEVADPA